MRLGDSVKTHIRSNIFTYGLVIILFIVGVSFGTIAESMLSHNQTLELQGYIGTFITNLKQNQIASSTLLAVLLGHARVVAFFWLSGIFFVGLPLIVVGILGKGFILGFSMGFLLQEMGWQGVVFAVASLLPQNLVSLPLYFGLFVLAITHAIKSLRRNPRRRGRRRIRQPLSFFHYSALCLVVMALLVFAGVVEIYITPLLMRLVVTFM